MADQHVEVQRSDNDKLRSLVARKLRLKAISRTVWQSDGVRAGIARHEIQRDDASLEDLVADVRTFRERLRKAAGLRSTAPRSARRREFRAEKLSVLESARTMAYSQALAHDAFESGDVHEFWEQQLQKRWLTPDEADNFLASPAIRLVPFWDLHLAGVPVFGLDSTFGERGLRPDGSWRAEVTVPSLERTWAVTGSILPGPGARGIVSNGLVEGHAFALIRDARGVVFNVGYWTRSTLDELRNRALRLGEKYGWNEYEAIWFLLTAQAPGVPPLTGSISNDLTGRVQLTVAPWISDKTLLAFMRQMRLAAVGRTTLRTNALSFEVFAFVERETTLAGAQKQTWDSLRQRWNQSVREKDGFQNDTQIRNRYRQAARVIRRYIVASDARGLGRWEKLTAEQRQRTEDSPT